MFLKDYQKLERIEPPSPKTKILSQTKLPTKNPSKTIVLAKTVLTQFRNPSIKNISFKKIIWVLPLLVLSFFLFKDPPQKTKPLFQTEPTKKEAFTELAVHKMTGPKSILTRLTLLAKPRGAKIVMRDDKNSFTTKDILEKTFFLKENENIKIDIEVSYDGFLTRTKTITLDHQTKNYAENIELEKIPYGQIHIEARPWAFARIKNQEQITPTRFEKIPAGKQTLQLFFPPKNQTLTEEILITSNETLNCRASFAKKASVVCK